MDLMSNKMDEGHQLTMYLAGNNKYIQYKTQKGAHRF